jgi:BNR/Asp-box repeat
MGRLRKIQMAGWAKGRRRISAPASILAIAVAAVATVAVTGAFTGALTAGSGAPGPALNRQQIALHILSTQAAGVMTAPARAALRMLATGSRELSPGPAPRGLPVVGLSGPASSAGNLAKPAFTNVRVNDPALDTHQLDQTTQSETTIAVAGSHVAVGYNDSQQSGLFLTAGSSITGYSYSANGGASFTDGGALPNTPEFVNFGDPWLASTRSGGMYFSNLALDFFNFNLDVSVAKSTDGGKTFGTPVPVFRPPFSTLYFGDKPALATGPDPAVTSRDDLYVAYDDFSVNFNIRPIKVFDGLPVARSTDGGKTWKLAYAARFLQPRRGCSFQQFIGATPIVNPATGTLYVVAEKLAVTDPHCQGAPLQRSEWIFRSTDGGTTFAPGVKIASVTEAVPDGLLFLGPGRYMRDLEFPAIALHGSAISVAWNDRASGHSHIRLATSTDGGRTWTARFVTHGSGDEVQPALSADASGIHLLYYHRNPNNTLDVLAGNSRTGTGFSQKRVTTQSFPGALTIPQFDPTIAFGYMGDYIANVSDGAHEYFAWGDNRDTVTDFLYPNGRADPDVFFARQ